MIYVPFVADGYEWVTCSTGEGLERIMSLDGAVSMDTWEPVRVKLVTRDEGVTFKQSDFPWMGKHAIVMRERAAARLGSLVEPCGQLLPLASEDGSKLFLLNVTQVIDAMDEPRSDVKRDSFGYMMYIKSIAFKASVVGGSDIFRLPDRGSFTYVSDKFVQAVQEARLVGLTFDEVWSGE